MRPLRFACLFSTLLSTTVVAQSVQGPRGALNFHNFNVCPAGQTSPAPCSGKSKVNYRVLATTTFGPTKVVTQGVSNLDFILSATTCRGTLTAGSSCFVRVAFAPLAPGVRMGAVQLMDASGNLLASTYIYGNGQAPVAAFTPAVQIDLPVGGFDGGAMAVDAAGEVYFTVGGGVAKFDPQTGEQVTVATGLPGLFGWGLAVDGAGNVLYSSGKVVRIDANTGAQTFVGKDLNSSVGVAVDGKGNLYVGDDWDAPLKGLFGWPRLAEVFATNLQGQQTLLSGFFGDQGNPVINFPWGVAVDAVGNAYIAGFNFGPVFESLVNTPPQIGPGVIGSRQNTVVGDFNNPSAVAVDAAGDVYVADGGFDTNGIYEVSAADSAQTLLVEGPWEVQIAIDASADLFFPSSNMGGILEEVQASKPVVLDFGNVRVGSTSAPLSIVFQNVGNQALNSVPPGLSVSAGFKQVPGSGSPADCSPNFSLAPGARCNLSIVFTPQLVGLVMGTATFTDNALNKAPSVTQSVPLKGTGD